MIGRTASKSLLILLLLAAASLAGEREAVVKVATPDGSGQRTCSGVCVSPSGLILTAGHCRPSDRSRILFGENSYTARALKLPSGREGVAVLKITAGEELPFLPIASSSPQPGEKVYALGWPAGQWSRSEGQIKGNATISGVQMVVASFRILEGTSGGPLLNENGEVVGIASGRSFLPDELRYHSLRSGTPYDPKEAEPASYWMPAEMIHEALEGIGGTGERSARRAGAPTLYIFTDPVLCAPCQRFESDRRANREGIADLLARFDLVEVRPAPLGWSRSEAVRKFTARFGTPPATPTFWVEGAADYFGGYLAEGGARRLREYLVQFVGGPDRPHDPGPIDASPEIDWSAVTIIVLVAERDVGRLRGALRGKALELAAGPLERRAAELTGGKAQLVIVAERNEPARFEAVRQAARVDPDPLTVLVMVARQEIGLKGFIAGKIEEILAGRLDAAPVDLVFERVHRNDFEAIRGALEVQESAQPLVPESREESRESVLGRIHERLETLRETVQSIRGGAGDESPDGRLPLDRLALGGLSAWMTERLKLVRKLGWLAGLVFGRRRRE